MSQNMHIRIQPASTSGISTACCNLASQIRASEWNRTELKVEPDSASLISKSARLVAGRVEIASKPNHGTRLAVKIPV